MKNIFFISTLLIALIGYSQYPTCQHKHTFLDNIPDPMYQSGIESLRSDTIDVQHYDVYLDFTQAGSGTLKGNCEVKFTTLMDVNSISLDLLQLTIDSIVYHNAQISYNYNDTLIIALFGSTITSGNTDSLTVYYHGSPQTDPSGWGGYYAQSGYYYNLGVGFESIPHNYGRVWHPCFDNFVERATYDFTVLTSNNETAYCNGTRTNVQTAGTDSLLTNWSLSIAIPSYLASVAVSNYTHVVQTYYSTLQSINIPIWLAAQETDTTNMKNSFINLNGALSAFETAYGPYVWERIGYVLVPFNAGAMEHATNIAYPLATVNGNTAFETLMAHELSHHWWGDWVTCETAEEMWINEGMAVYSEHLFLESVYDQATYMDAMRTNHKDVLHRAHIDDSGFYALNAVPLSYTYGEHSYRKGADVMHTLRNYVGDANFFLGLQTIQTNFGGGNISSTEFRDEFNSLTGVDVTDFFNDWILNPGFSQFSVESFSSTANGSDFDVQVIVDQKLKGASSYHSNVPLTLTFMDASYTIHEEAISVSGSTQTFNFTIPIDPVFAALNMDEKINDAVTASATMINSTGVTTMSYANATLNTTQITDSCFIRIEHNWVSPSYNGGPANVVASQDRYWNVHGVDLQNMEGKLTFVYNGQNNASGDLDNSILKTWGSETFREDSIVLLYRPNETAAWEIHPDFYTTMGSPFDKTGNITTQLFMAGQYTFGYKTNSSGLAENADDKTYSIYPNPTDDSMFIDLSNWQGQQYLVDIYEISGKYIRQHKLSGNTVNKVSIGDLNSGLYLVILSDSNGQRIGSKRIVKK
ncbi:MAG: M1 family aminopeptidase [Crocinitomicaceae bacterium]|nr:T9SS type A sorting domain-containing protein [Crocinitomicaceae bacterium]